MKNSFVQQCLNVLKRDDIKNEFRTLLNPILDFILLELSPYIYIILAIICLIFIMIFAILVILILVLKNNNNKLLNI